MTTNDEKQTTKREFMNAAAKEMAWLCVERKNQMSRECSEFYEFAKNELEKLIANLFFCDERRDDATFIMDDDDVWLSIRRARAAFGVNTEAAAGLISSGYKMA